MERGCSYWQLTHLLPATAFQRAFRPVALPSISARPSGTLSQQFSVHSGLCFRNQNATAALTKVTTMCLNGTPLALRRSDMVQRQSLSFEDRSSEVGSFEASSFKVGSFKVGRFEVGSFEVGSVEVGSFEIGSVEVGLLKVGSEEFASLQVRFAE